MQPAAAALCGTCRIEPRVGKLGQAWAALWDFKDLYELVSESLISSSSLDLLCHIRLPHRFLRSIPLRKAPCFKDLWSIFLLKPCLLSLFLLILIFSYLISSPFSPMPLMRCRPLAPYYFSLRQPVTHFPTSSLVAFYICFLLLLYQITSDYWLKTTQIYYVLCLEIRGQKWVSLGENQDIDIAMLFLRIWEVIHFLAFFSF